MPISNHWHIPTVLHYITALKPLRVLDVGVGMGNYGFLLRQNLDINYERIRKESWLVTIDGIEVFEGYRNPVWDYAYNKVLMGDVRTKLDCLECYDLIMCNDVLEHFEEQEAKQLIRKFSEKSSVLIATAPSYNQPQGAWGGNEAETHRCALSANNFINLIAWKHTGATNFFICSNDQKQIAIIRKVSARCPVARPEMLPVVEGKFSGVCRRLSRVWLRLTTSVKPHQR
jgi:hypothetical protein